MILAVFSGIVTALALPNELFPTGSVVLGLICVVPYFIALARADTGLDAARMGAVYGAVSTAASNYWLAFFRDFSVWTLGGTTAGYALIHAFFAPILMRLLRERELWRPFAVAATWAGYEYLKSVGFLAYPWGLLAYPPSEILVYVQHVEVTGIWSLSFITAAANGVLADVFLRTDTVASPVARRIRAPDAALQSGAFVLILVALAVGFGIWRYANPIPVSRTARVALVQHNADQWRPGEEERSMRRAQQLTRDALAAGDTQIDLVAWSETTLQRPYPENPRFYRTRPEGDPLVPFLQEIDTPLVTGAPVVLDAETGAIMNGAVLIEPSGRMAADYGKQHLVPLAENIPFWNLEPVRRFYRDVIGIGRGWTVGPEHKVFAVTSAGNPEETIRFGPPICFEDSFGYLTRGFVLLGGDILVNLTNNSWSRTESAQIQHFVSARFRAIENRTALARATNSGLTTIVDAYGRVLDELPMFEPGVLVADVPIYETENFTLYTMYGDWLGKLFVAIAVLLAGGLYLRDYG